MNDSEKKELTEITDKFSQLSENKKMYVLGFLDGSSMAAEKKANQEN